MNRKLFLFIGVVGVVGFLIFIFTGGLGDKQAAVRLTSFPQATVFINDQEAGQTPYENDELKAGEITFKLVPEATFSATWERKISLTPNAQTIVSWEFDPSSEHEGGAVLYLEKTSLKNKSGLIVTCQPDNCSVSVDGQMRGYAPLNLEDVGEGSHRILISLPGYKSREVMARTVSQYRLVAEVKLAKEIVSSEVEDPTDEKEADLEDGSGKTTESDLVDEPYVLIKETPTGWLRVRLGPTTNATEAAKIDPGEKFPYLGEENGWYKIEYEEDEEGWISGAYADKFE